MNSGQPGVSVICSVIIPIYNTGDYLHETITSVLNQSERNIEIIIIDDGSTDESLAVAQGYATQDTRISCLSQKNAGDSAARNVGVKHAKGKYVIFLDHDDVLEPDAVEHQVSILEGNASLKLALGSNEVIDSDSNHVKDNIVDEKLFSAKEVAFGLTPSFSQCIYRLEALEAIGGFNPEAKNAADHDLNLRLLGDEYAGFAHTRKVMKYRIHPNQQTKSPSKLMHNHQLALHNYYGKNSPHSNPALLKKIDAHWHEYYGQFLPSEILRLLKGKRFKDARFALGKYTSGFPYTARGTLRFIKKKITKR